MKINTYIMKQKMAKRGFTLKDLSFQSDRSEKHLKEILRTGKCSVPTALKLSRVLGVPFCKFVI